MDTSKAPWNRWPSSYKQGLTSSECLKTSLSSSIKKQMACGMLLVSFFRPDKQITLPCEEIINREQSQPRHLLAQRRIDRRVGQSTSDKRDRRRFRGRAQLG